MREIKFRAWNKKTSKIVDLYSITPLATDPNFNQDGLFIPFDEDYILMQYIGRKDKNGREIFEGDIIKNYYNYYDEKEKKWIPVTENMSIIWNEHWCQFSFNSNRAVDHWGEMEVIGNIYENPELLLSEHDMEMIKEGHQRSDRDTRRGE